MPNWTKFVSDAIFECMSWPVIGTRTSPLVEEFGVLHASPMFDQLIHMGWLFTPST